MKGRIRRWLRGPVSAGSASRVKQATVKAKPRCHWADVPDFSANAEGERVQAGHTSCAESTPSNRRVDTKLVERRAARSKTKTREARQLARWAVKSTRAWDEKQQTSFSGTDELTFSKTRSTIPIHAMFRFSMGEP